MIYVPKSFAAPHQVRETDRQIGKFFMRRSNGVVEMNLTELRAAFNLSEVWVERIKGFRRERIALIESRSEELPSVLPERPTLVVHLVPLSLASGVEQANLDNYMKIKWYDRFWKYFSIRFNLDGIARIPPPNTMTEYIQIFRNGAVECVFVLSDKEIEMDAVEVRTVEFVIQATAVQAALDTLQPVAVMVS